MVNGGCGRWLQVVRLVSQDWAATIYVEPGLKRELPEHTTGLLTWNGSDCPPHEIVATLDLVITLGGDGTVLWASALLGDGPMPALVAFAMGSLGFMTPHAPVNLKACLDRVHAGGFELALRHRLSCRICRSSGVKASGLCPASSTADEEHVVINEVVLDRGVAPFLTNLECFCDDTFITVVQGDGLIVSTPSGSTAYSLAAGGSMVHPQVPGILFTPICPHSLSFRPLVFPENIELRVQVPMTSRSSVWASFDGKDRVELRAGDAVVIRVSQWPVPTVCAQNTTQDWFRSVTEGLHWNRREIQSALVPVNEYT
ncbi:hypothetical protein CYMTET_54509 [Cymbomonas tetramitiformis]|uniref:NAD(+) kinase n=1 Tax=Cymbomonas tetramitiformis TaxID=36881 RepID=A0AAE0BGK0_9CHLO|nr:hypothetical protein CYMTET_54509 [Cymbomonas tetramitiformis]